MGLEAQVGGRGLLVGGEAEEGGGCSWLTSCRLKQEAELLGALGEEQNQESGLI